MIHHIDQSSQFALHSNLDDVFIYADFGDGQGGSYSVFLEKTPKGSRIDANSPKEPPVRVGNGNEIGDKDIFVSAVCRDRLMETNWTSVTIYLKEGSREALRYGPYSYQVPQNYDTVIYTLNLVRR